MTKEALKEAIIQRLRINCGCSPRQMPSISAVPARTGGR